MSQAYAQITYPTAPAAAFAGLRVPNPGDIIEGRIQGEASAAIPFGYAVKRHGSDATKAILPAAETDKVLGLVCHSYTYMEGTTYDSTATPAGVKPGASLDILRRGRIWVIAEDAVSAGDRGWIRCTAGSGAEYVGGVSNADEGTEMVDCTKQVEFLTAAGAGALALVEVDFTREAD